MAQENPGLFDEAFVRRAFFARLAQGDSVLAVCRALKIQPSSAYEARRCIAGFAERWDAIRPPRASRQKVPLKGGRGGWHARFFEHFAESGNIVQAARAAGVAPATVHRQRTIDEDFNRQFIASRDMASDMAEGRLLYQCIHGFERTIIRDGVEVRINEPCPGIVLKVLDRYWARDRVQRRGPGGQVASIPRSRYVPPVWDMGYAR